MNLVVIFLLAKCKKKKTFSYRIFLCKNKNVFLIELVKEWFVQIVKKILQNLDITL